MPTQPFLLLVPLVPLSLTWLLIAEHRERLGLPAISVRGCLVIAYVLFEAFVALATELTSLGHHLDTTVVRAVWIVVTLLLAVVAWPDLRRHARRLRGHEPLRRLRALSVEETVWVATIVAIFGVLAVIGWLYPPANADSMVYHLPRVVHWIQNRSVAQFATHYLAQIELSPLHEYNLVHLHLLTGGSDRLDGYVQLAAAAISVVGASEIARLLGASRRGQVMAAVIAVTIPTGILEATSTQNNYFAASLGVGILVVLLAWRPGRLWAFKAMVLGAGTGLAVLTKGTLPALIAPAAVLLAAVVFWREYEASGPRVALRRLLAVGLVAGVSALVVAGPFLVRNIDLFGGTTGPVSQSTIDTEFHPKTSLGNVIRSTAADFWIGNGHSGFETEVSRFVLNTSKGLYDDLGVSASDQRFALGTNTHAFSVIDYTHFARSEDFGANPWQVVLLVAAGLTIAGGVLLGRRSLRLPLLLAIGLACGYLVFTGTARWSTFNVRYQLPLLIAWSPLIALVLDRLWKTIGIIVLAGLTIAALPALLDNVRRPLIHPLYHFTSALQPYFLDLQAIAGIGGLGVSAPQYQAVTDAVTQSGCKKLGLADQVFVEYPLWAGLRNAHWHGTIEQIDVANVSRQVEDPTFHPCAELRQVATSYAAPDDHDLHLRYGNLSLSMAPSRLRSLRAPAPGFSSAVPDVRIAPGGGWSLGSTSREPALVGSGSLYLDSGQPQEVRLQLIGDLGALQLEVQSATLGATAGPITQAQGVTSVPVQLVAGLNHLQLGARGPDGRPARLVLRGVRVAASTAAGPDAGR